MENISNNSDETVFRRRAQELLNVQHAKSNPAFCGMKNPELLQELEVQQIELKLQYEELIGAWDRAKSAEEKYSELENKYRELYDFAPIGYVRLSIDGKINELNSMAAQILGKEQSSLKTCAFIPLVSDGTKSIFNHFLNRIFNGFSAESCEVVLISEVTLPVNIYLTGIAMKKNEQCLITMVDITEQKKTESDLETAKNRAEENDRLKTAFLHNMSHEIRTPMCAIMGFSGLMVEYYNNKSKLEEFSSIIHQSCTNLLDMMNDILDIAKIESGQLSITMEECDLNVLFVELTSILGEYQKLIGKQHILITLHAHINPTESVIVTDKGKLKQIFTNLISNALKFTDEGTIDAGCKYDEHHNLSFYVADTGIGIPTDKQTIIFERFAQIHQNTRKSTGGTGLGLSIVKGLVNLLGGEIQLTSVPGTGSTFTFSIQHSEPNAIQHELLSLTGKPKEYHFANKLILVIEDDTFSAQYLMEVLSESGIDALCAINGTEAIEISLSQPVEMLLLDIRLPDLDGYSVIRQIKQHKPHLKIIAQTAYASPDERQKALEAGCIDYISKPINKELLLAMISKHLYAASDY